jgi:hypothetical protein
VTSEPCGLLAACKLEVTTPAADAEDCPCAPQCDARQGMGGCRGQSMGISRREVNDQQRCECQRSCSAPQVLVPPRIVRPARRCSPCERATRTSIRALQLSGSLTGEGRAGTGAVIEPASEPCCRRSQGHRSA